MMSSIKSGFKLESVWIYIVWIIPLVFPLFDPSPYYLDMMVYVLLWTGIGAAWNLSAGYGGLLSIGHTAYFGIGAYTSAILYVNHGISPWIGMIAGAVIATLSALVIGVLTLRLRGTFYTLATIAFASIAGLLAVALKGLTNGSLGIIIPFEPGFGNMTWSGKGPYIYLMFVFAFGMYLLCKWVEKRRFGISLLALRDNEEAALSLGVNTAVVKIKSTLISAFFTSIGGTLYAQYILFIEPASVFNVNLSVQFALVAIVGGIAVAFGPFVGSVIFVLLSSGLRGWLTQVDGLSGFLYGVLLIIIVMFMPDGLMPKIAKLFSRPKRKSGERIGK